MPADTLPEAFERLREIGRGGRHLDLQSGRGVSPG
jgi:hypothetical protein